MEPFTDRRQAGRKLGQQLQALQADWSEPGLVLALPRGGVPVACEVARLLGWHLEVWVVRKLSSPQEPELALGAIAEGGGRFVDARLVELLGVSESELEQIEQIEQQELARRIHTYRPDRPQPQVQGRRVLVVDDGLATGATVRATAMALQKQQPAWLGLAVPVASRAALEAVRPLFDHTTVLWQPPSFSAVGACYQSFPQISDQEVLSALA